ncbi:DUF378 domain-containing protein [Clostridium thermarum]|uniref:DUF378 domain-containing protein n=1 Tax=Clostridium thermarum TaxID=1716543 RepID=UPI0013D44619|nr:DUF378 domain-containing protein [Clostridium thermarum]
MYKLSLLDKISIILVIIGALNWGLIGIANFNFVAQLTSILGEISSIFERIIYILVGLAGLNLAFLIYKSKNQRFS